LITGGGLETNFSFWERGVAFSRAQARQGAKINARVRAPSRTINSKEKAAKKRQREEKRANTKLGKEKNFRGGGANGAGGIADAGLGKGIEM